MSQNTKTERLTAEQFKAENIIGRPFLHEQGQIVTRGFVEKFSLDEDGWELTLRDVDVLNKRTGAWERDISGEPEIYGSTHQFSSYYKYVDHKRGQTMLEIGGYAMTTYIGEACDKPWQKVYWPELETEMFPGGVMEP